MAEKNSKEEKPKERGRVKKLSGTLKKIVPKRKSAEEEVVEKPIILKEIEDPFSVLKFVLMTEKAIQNIERQNKLVFIVNRNSDKDDIRKAAEAVFKTQIADVKTLIDQKSRKRAVLKFKEPGTAGEIAIRLGII